MIGVFVTSLSKSWNGGIPGKATMSSNRGAIMRTSAGCWGKSVVFIKAVLSASTYPILIRGVSNCVPHERQDIGLFLDDLAYRLARTVAGLSFDSNQDRIRAPLRSLQCRRELERVSRHNSIVMIPGRHQSRRITISLLDVLERRILDQVIETPPECQKTRSRIAMPTRS